MSSDFSTILLSIAAGYFIGSQLAKNKESEGEQDKIPNSADVIDTESEFVNDTQSIGISTKGIDIKTTTSPAKMILVSKDENIKENEKIIKLLDGGHNTEAVGYACKKLFELIREKSRFNESDETRFLDGTQLVDNVFSPKKPVLRFTNHDDYSNLDTHEGYYYLLKGVALAFRNTVMHTNIELTEEEVKVQFSMIAYLYDLVNEYAVLVEKDDEND